MSKGTKIEWATDTVNWLAGCRKKSPACKNCYAERMTARLATMPHAPSRYRSGVVTDRRFNGVIAYDPKAMTDAFQAIWLATRQMRVFVNSVSDTFDPAVPPESLTDLAEMIKVHGRYLSKRRDDHALMLLTKCPERMAAWQAEHFPDGLPALVWCGTTVEDQEHADERIPHLLRVSARVRFLSCEPLLGAIDMRWALGYTCAAGSDAAGCGWFGPGDDARGDAFVCPNCGGETCPHAEHAGDDGVAAGIHWVIAGGESGPGARPSHPDWFRSLRDQCEEAGVPFHFKQVGDWAEHDGPPMPGDRWLDAADGCHAPWTAGDEVYPGEALMRRVGKKAAGRMLDGRAHDGAPS